MIQIAALYVETEGCYFGLPGVDPWDKARDARKYRGNFPVVAHPPCQRWGKLWAGQPLAIICPAQTGATDCCATCALCWNSVRSIAFRRH